MATLSRLRSRLIGSCLSCNVATNLDFTDRLKSELRASRSTVENVRLRKRLKRLTFDRLARSYPSTITKIVETTNSNPRVFIEATSTSNESLPLERYHKDQM